MHYQRPALVLVSLLCLCAVAVPAQARHHSSPPPVAAPAAPPLPSKTLSSGSYIDSAGTAHLWHITPSHMLEWDGSPYLPVGGSFTPHYWAEGQTDANWNADVQALQTLHQHGVTDLLLNAGTVGLMNVPPAAVQRLLDYLDTNGFDYGIKIADFPDTPLVGYTIEPTIYRNPSPPQQGPVKFSQISGLVSAFYMLAAARNAQQIESGIATVNADGSAVVNLQAGGPGDVLLLYPQRQFTAGSPESHLPNLWDSYGEYRDHLLAFFNHIKLGKGFRFFLDPLSSRMGMYGEVQDLIPTSTGFQLGFEAWLDQKYSHNLDELNREWGLENHDMPDFDTAARCIPLWKGAKGVPALYDPQTHTVFDVFNQNGISNQYWLDLQSYKMTSVESDMNSIADVLKHGVANVPVVYTWTQHSPLFADSDTNGGYDGLGIEAYGHGLDLTRGAGAYVYAQAQESPKTTWVIVSATADSSPDQKLNPGFLSKAVLFDDWDALKQVGARGFFVNSLQTLPDKDNRNVNLVDMPDQLPWLGTYAAVLQASARSLADQQPQVLWYPQNVAAEDVGVRLLPDGVWWLPTYSPGASLILGPSLLGYTFTDPSTNQLTNVVWSPHDAVKTTQFGFGKKANPVITTPTGTIVQTQEKNDIWTVPVGDTPTIIRGVPTLPLPIGAPDAAEAEAKRLITLASSLSIDAEVEEQNFFRAQNDTHDIPAEAEQRYTEFRVVVAELIAELRPYAWLEGENPTTTNFTSTVPDMDASGGAYLSLNTDQSPSSSDPTQLDTGNGYSATYTFYVDSPSVYSFWMAGSPLGADSSQFTWQVDQNQSSFLPPNPVTAGGIYAGQFEWTELGRARLYVGKHTLTIAVDSRSRQDGRYALDIDAFCISRTPFNPDGPIQPSVDSWLPPAPPPDKKGKKKH